MFLQVDDCMYFECNISGIEYLHNFVQHISVFTHFRTTNCIETLKHRILSHFVTYQSVSQSINLSIHLSSNQSINQSINHSLSLIAVDIRNLYYMDIYNLTKTLEQ